MWLVGLVFCAITAALASRKGYHPAAWFCAAGVIGLVVLAFLPFVNARGTTAELAAARVHRGNVIGGVISGLAIVGLLLGLVSS